MNSEPTHFLGPIITEPVGMTLALEMFVLYWFLGITVLESSDCILLRRALT